MFVTDPVTPPGNPKALSHWPKGVSSWKFNLLLMIFPLICLKAQPFACCVSPVWNWFANIRQKDAWPRTTWSNCDWHLLATVVILGLTFGWKSENIRVGAYPHQTPIGFPNWVDEFLHIPWQFIFSIQDECQFVSGMNRPKTNEWRRNGEWQFANSIRDELNSSPAWMPLCPVVMLCWRTPLAFFWSSGPQGALYSNSCITSLSNVFLNARLQSVPMTLRPHPSSSRLVIRSTSAFSSSIFPLYYYFFFLFCFFFSNFQQEANIYHFHFYYANKFSHTGNNV